MYRDCDCDFDNKSRAVVKFVDYGDIVNEYNIPREHREPFLKFLEAEHIALRSANRGGSVKLVRLQSADRITFHYDRFLETLPALRYYVGGVEVQRHTAWLSRISEMEEAVRATGQPHSRTITITLANM